MAVRLNARLNTILDRLVRPRVRVRRRSWSSFQVCGYTGLALAILLAMALVLYRSLMPWVMAAIVLAAVLTFFALAFATKLITGEEQLIYYHHEIAVVATTTLLLWALRQPVLAYLDATVLGIGMFLACGRVGCLMVGCCHGRPHRWGVRYRDEHAAPGFTPYYVGVRLFPIQAVESLWVCGIVVAGSAMVLRGQPPGAALAWYVVAYDVGRFCFEFVRGDPDRPYHRGFSSAQWLSLLLTCAVVGAEFAGVLPWRPWHAGAAVALAGGMIAVTLHRRARGAGKWQLLQPRHVKEVAEAVELVSRLATGGNALVRLGPVPPAIHVGQTSLGVQISAGRSPGATGWADHYTLSARQGALTEDAARVLAGLILQLRHHAGPSEVIAGNRGVFHLVLYPAP